VSDTHQAIYDAVRSRVSTCDTHEAIQSAVREAFSSVYHAVQSVAQEFSCAAYEQQRPSVLYRPAIERVGDTWVASYSGVRVAGGTPALAMTEFDRKWNSHDYQQPQDLPRSG